MSELGIGDTVVIRTADPHDLRWCGSHGVVTRSSDQDRFVFVAIAEAGGLEAKVKIKSCVKVDSL